MNIEDKLIAAIGSSNFEDLLLEHLKKQEDLSAYVDDAYADDIEFSIARPHELKGGVVKTLIRADCILLRPSGCCDMPRSTKDVIELEHRIHLYGNTEIEVASSDHSGSGDIY